MVPMTQNVLSSPWVQLQKLPAKLSITLVAEGEKVGMVAVHLYRPFSAKHFLAAVPKTCKTIAVLDRTKEPGATGEPLYLDVKDWFLRRSQCSGYRRRSLWFGFERYHSCSDSFCIRKPCVANAEKSLYSRYRRRCNLYFTSSKKKKLHWAAQACSKLSSTDWELTVQ